MPKILTVESDERDGIAIELEDDFRVILSQDGMTIGGPEMKDLFFDWESTDRIFGLARGAKVIYASGDTPRVVR